ncbi:MAG: CoA transferase subunit A [Chloroflexi bacterium]|nr:CoA transferase subunit A [Chloroflexota bacterium]
MRDKTMTMREAVAQFVPDSSAVAMGLALESLIPFAAAHELIRQRKKNLTLIGPISDMLFDQLIGAGCVSRVIAAWVGNVSAGLGHNYRRAMEGKQVDKDSGRQVVVEDHSNFSISLALKAGAMGVPFIPTRSLLGTDLLQSNSNFRILEDDGAKLVRVPAVVPDVAILHVQRSAADGSAHCWGNLGISEEAALAAQRVIVVAEEIVPASVIRSDPNRVLVPAFKVCAVVHEPGGAHPSPVQGHYNRDHAMYQEYHQASRTQEGFVSWLDSWVVGVEDRESYLDKVGAERWGALQVKTVRNAAAVNYGD